MFILENGQYIVKANQEIPAMLGITMTYDEKVVVLIREKYSLDEELAIQRQRDTKPEEFKAYFTYCEECKDKAKQL
ncbi:MAG: hypothetical protein E7413_06170 [Ruminococcaceae bacterium]|nr:hypothetical protein [Oscillospiraceae bacterium]